MSAYDNDPRVRRWRADVRTFEGPDGTRYTVNPDFHGDRPDLWVLGPATCPVEVQRDHAAYLAWDATLPRFDSLDTAIASVIGGPQL